MSMKFIQPRFGALPRRLRELTPGKVRRAASKAIERELTKLVDEQFDGRDSPEGRNWAPRKPPTGTWPLLEKTGKMRRGFKVVASAAQVQITNTQDYIKYHQHGTSRMVARPVMPSTPGLTPQWTERVDAAVADAIRKIAE